jgi:hypothetical protein
VFVRLLHMLCTPHFELNFPPPIASSRKLADTSDPPVSRAEGLRGTERLMRHDEGLARVVVDGFILAGPPSSWHFEDKAAVHEICTSFTLSSDQKLSLKRVFSTILPPPPDPRADPEPYGPLLKDPFRTAIYHDRFRTFEHRLVKEDNAERAGKLGQKLSRYNEEKELPS